MTNKFLIQGNQNQLSVLYLFAVPVIIFLYFLQWKSHLFYGDDLYTYSYYVNLTTFLQKMNLPMTAGKFRPIHGISLQLLIDSFGSNPNGYYWFNVSIQAINTFIFASILNFYLRSHFLSLVFSLLLGLSRFTIYNLTQLTNGGALEGLAMIFTLLCLYFVIKDFRYDGADSKGFDILYTILFANLSTYTHERYIVLFPFLLLCVLFKLIRKKCGNRQAVLMISLIIASIVVNVLLKKYVFGMAFFLGTSSTHITFSFANAISFLKDAVYSIFLINTGQDYVAGVEFNSMATFYKVLIIIILICVFLGFANYIRTEIRNSSFKLKYITPGATLFILLGMLFFLFLIPTVLTVRLEQRWLQASLAVSILMIVMAISSFKFRSPILRTFIFSVFALLILIADREYLNKGADKLFMMTSGNAATLYKTAIDNGTIRASATRLYMWEKIRNKNNEDFIQWTLGGGDFFKLYAGKHKDIIFIDSVYEKSHSLVDSVLFHFNVQSDQIIYGGNKILDITTNFIDDSLRSFDVERAEAGVSLNKPKYDSVHLIADQSSFHNFYTDGFYAEENGIRWTNGNASIGFIGDYRVKDSVYITLTAYLPPACKNIVPSLSLISNDNKSFKAVSLEKNGGNFFYRMYFEKKASISKIVIQSDTINSFPDLRKLSFPFIALEIKQSINQYKK